MKTIPLFAIALLSLQYSFAQNKSEDISTEEITSPLHQKYIGPADLNFSIVKYDPLFVVGLPPLHLNFIAGRSLSFYLQFNIIAECLCS